MVLIITSLYVLYASFVYNNAIAATDTDLIANAVIILFVVDLDEMMFSIWVTINPHWFPKDDSLEVTQEKVETLESKLEVTEEKVNTLESKLLAAGAAGAATNERVECLEREVSKLLEKVERMGQTRSKPIGEESTETGVGRDP